ncbi:MAG: hypothetical protein J6Y44_01595 [Clostridia bacterium]|nr:hypothetical protein [Clostridia bacterium]
MKKKSLFFKIIFAVILAGLAVTAFVNGLIFHMSKDYEHVVYAVLLTLASFAVWYVVHGVVHELFHALAVKIFYGKVLSIAFCGLEISFVKGTKKLKFNFKSAFVGATEFVCLKPEKAHITLFTSLLGGFIGTILVLLALLTLHVFTNGFFAYFFILMGFFPIAYLALLNFVFGGDDSDGRLLFSGDGNIRFIRAAMRLETESYLYEGKDMLSSKPVNMIALFEDDSQVSYYDYLAALQDGNTELSLNVLDSLEEQKNGDNSVIDEFIAPEIERIFVNYVTKGEWNEEAFSAAKDSIIDSDDINAMRIHCAYRCANGEAEWANALKNGYYKACDGIWVKGLAETYREIGEKGRENL